MFKNTFGEEIKTVDVLTSLHEIDEIGKRASTDTKKLIGNYSGLSSDEQQAICEASKNISIQENLEESDEAIMIAIADYVDFMFRVTGEDKEIIFRSLEFETVKSVLKTSIKYEASLSRIESIMKKMGLENK